MGTFTNPRVHYGLTITGNPTKTLVANEQSVGNPLTTVALTGDHKGYSVGLAMGAGTSATVDLTTNTWSSLTAGTAQVETATAAGTITASGNATVVVTSARVTGSPLTVSVAVVNGDTAATWAGKVRTALAANTAIADFFDVSGSTTAIVLTSKQAIYANDATLNISLANGTCTGITTAATSANTTAGVAGAILTNSTGDAKDFEGVTLGTITPVAVLVKCLSGSVQFTEMTGTSAGLMSSGQFYFFTSSVIVDMTFAPSETSTIELTVLGTV